MAHQLYKIQWSVENCAEIWAVRNGILSGIKFDNMLLRTIEYKEGNFDKPCNNCQEIFKNFINKGTLISD